MKCPFCAHDETQVIDSRNMEEGKAVRRRRRCIQCDKRYTTYERFELILPTVVKRDGNRIEFNPAKLRASMMLALRKRPVAVDLLDKAIHNIQEALLVSGLREIPSEKIGEYVLQELKKLDKVAYVRFASVYKKFEDVDEFTNVIREMGS